MFWLERICGAGHILSGTCKSEPNSRQHFSECFNVCWYNSIKKNQFIQEHKRSFAFSRGLVLCQLWRLPWLTLETKLSAFWKSLCLIGFSGFFYRVINAGKSTHNEDQASCEVLTVKKKAGAITSTPNRNSTKRRSSLPNGEGLQLKENSVRPSFIPALRWEEHAHSGPTVRFLTESRLVMKERKAVFPEEMESGAGGEYQSKLEVTHKWRTGV